MTITLQSNRRHDLVQTSEERVVMNESTPDGAHLKSDAPPSPHLLHDGIEARSASVLFNITTPGKPAPSWPPGPTRPVGDGDATGEGSEGSLRERQREESGGGGIGGLAVGAGALLVGTLIDWLRGRPNPPAPSGVNGNAGGQHAPTLGPDGHHPAEFKPKAAAATERAAVAEAMAAGNRQKAIDLAIAAWGLRPGAIYKGDLHDDGATEAGTGQVFIGTQAFKGTDGWLASTIAHENIHARQLFIKHPADGGNNWAREGTLGAAVNELQAYDWEIRHADHFGLSDPERLELRARRAHLYGMISGDPYYRLQIGPEPGGFGNSYWIRTSDR